MSGKRLAGWSIARACALGTGSSARSGALLLMALTSVACGSSSDAAKGGGGASASGGSGSSGDGAGGAVDPSGGAGAPNPSGKGVTVTPKTTRVAFGGKTQFTALVTGVTDTSVTWSLGEGDLAGSLSASGEYTAPATSGTFHVVATSVADATLKDSATVTVAAPSGTRPVLTPGVWVNISPPVDFKCCPGVDNGNSYGVVSMEFDPANPDILYTIIDSFGPYKSVDGGTTWNQLGDKSKIDYTNTSFLDSPTAFKIDPSDSKHMYASQGVRGMTLGFFVSNDAGETFQAPQGFLDVADKVGNRDMTQMETDPTDFKHILLAGHSPWKNQANPTGDSLPPGYLESKDGGQTWIIHEALKDWPNGSKSIHFLYDPAQKLGNSETWLIAGEGGGMFRTEDSGKTYTKVTDASSPHGGNDTVYYAKDGSVYTGATPHPIRSTDNGKTWTALDNGTDISYYYTIRGDGNTLYTQLSAGVTDNGSPFLVSPESDGLKWTTYQSGTQKFAWGAHRLRYDAANKLMYNASWTTGLWVLRVLDP